MTEVQFKYRCRILTVAALVLTVGLALSAHAQVPSAATGFVAPNTGQFIIAVGYDNGTLEFRDWQGNLVAVRYGFGKVTHLIASTVGNSPLPRLFVASTDSGGALRVIDPTNINNDLDGRFGFVEITALDVWGEGDDVIYVGSLDSGGTLRKISASTLDDIVVRYGFVRVSAIWDTWDDPNEFLCVGSTDSGGTLRLLDEDTLANAMPPRYGFGYIYGFASEDMDWNGKAELVIASADAGGTIRVVEGSAIGADLATRSGFGVVYAMDYGELGIAQSGGGVAKATILVGAEVGGGSVWVLEVNTNPFSTTLADTASRFGFGEIGFVSLFEYYANDIDLAGVASTDPGTGSFFIMDENLTDLTVLTIP